MSCNLVGRNRQVMGAVGRGLNPPPVQWGGLNPSAVTVGRAQPIPCNRRRGSTQPLKTHIGLFVFKAKFSMLTMGYEVGFNLPKKSQLT